MGMVVSQPRCACVVGTDAISITGYAPLKPRPGRRAHQGRGGRAVAVREGRPRLGGGLSAPWRALKCRPYRASRQCGLARFSVHRAGEKTEMPMKDLGRLWRRRSVAGTAVAAATLGM